MNFSCGTTSEQQCAENRTELERFKAQTGRLPSTVSVILSAKLHSDRRSECCHVNKKLFYDLIPVIPVNSCLVGVFSTLSAHKSAFSCQVPKTQEPLWLLLEDEAGEADRDRVQLDLFSLDGACGRPRPRDVDRINPT